MSALSDAAEAALLDLIFLGTTWLSLAEDKVSAPYTSLYVSLHTGDPGETGNQTTSECAYTSYARVAVARTGSGWSRSTSTMSNVAAVTWPTATGGSETATYFMIGTDASGAGNNLVRAALSASLAISSGITPEAAIGGLTITSA